MQAPVCATPPNLPVPFLLSLLSLLSLLQSYHYSLIGRHIDTVRTSLYKQNKQACMLVGMLVRIAVVPCANS
ncbi:hypothetical protein GGS23DRAFT_589475 [Durotheca rogersii]|uniref:uncharacterized protein n=1 Tax=Durotheca rogersii TaxID=419775 RepID=UPI00221FAA0E|nr:uncharacterized protein GGS23DRAFT_589475 [Durotheca rogersii]KAI5855585.1 hypothetical protein GGS23DRAFT_589475 [Durotheca rogersii]